MLFFFVVYLARSGTVAHKENPPHDSIFVLKIYMSGARDNLESASSKLETAETCIKYKRAQGQGSR